MDEKKYQQYLSLLRRELIPAMGCTEPIALAYCGAAAQQAAGNPPPETLVEAAVLVSGNIIKNVKSVIVPNTGGLRGRTRALPPMQKGGTAYAGYDRDRRYGTGPPPWGRPV